MAKKDLPGEGTEAFALAEEELENEWQRDHGSRIPQVLEMLTGLMREGDAGWQKMSELFGNEDLFDPIKMTDAVGYLYLGYRIYVAEKELYGESPFSKLADCAEDYLEFFCEGRFQMFRMRFATDEEIAEEIGDEFGEFLDHYQVSYPCLITLFTSFAINAPKLAIRIAKALARLGREDLKLSFLSYVQEQMPGNLEILLMLADGYSKIDEGKSMVYLRQIPQWFWGMPNQMRVMEVQRSFWYFKYDRDDSGRGLGDVINSSGLGLDRIKGMVEMLELQDVIKLS